MKPSERELRPEERILEAALDVVMEKTISGTRMHLIAQKVEMVQSNLHYYFKTKEDLLIGLQNKVLRKCHELRAMDRKDAEDTLEAQLDIFFNQKRQFLERYQKYDFAEVDFWVQAQTNERIRTAFAESFSGWRADIGSVLDTYCPDMAPEKRLMIPAVLVSMLEGATLQYLIDDQSFDLNAYFDFCKKHILKMATA
ncbi:MAG: TetR/AcrR family transcriptional regulator [Clostridiales bacterium]|nr:TetR/AcrR family transcriptional regulator [Clostridiales bacterium]